MARNVISLRLSPRRSWSSSLSRIRPSAPSMSPRWASSRTAVGRPSWGGSGEAGDFGGAGRSEVCGALAGGAGRAGPPDPARPAGVVTVPAPDVRAIRIACAGPPAGTGEGRGGGGRGSPGVPVASVGRLGRLAAPPVIRQRDLEDVVDGDHAE